MEENKSLLIKKKENILDFLNLNESLYKDFNNIINSKYNHKLLLEKILSIIKNTQLEILSQKSVNKTSNKFSCKIIKNILRDLKKELNSIFKENKQKYKKIKYRPKNIRNNSLIQTFSDRVSKNILINKKINSELSNLKFINFKLENQIESIDNKIKFESYILNEKEHSHLLYIFLNEKNEGMLSYNLLHDNLLDIRDKFKIVVKKKEFQNNVILQLNTAINLWKEEHRLKNKKYKSEYVITSQIINEETKEYPTKTSSFENDNNNGEKEKINSNDMESNSIYKGKLIYINNCSYLDLYNASSL